MTNLGLVLSNEVIALLVKAKKVESNGKAIDFLDCLQSNPHQRSCLDHDQNNNIPATSGQNEGGRYQP